MKKSDTITTSTWFQRAPTSAWEEPVLIPTCKSPATSNSSLTLASTTIIKFKILSLKRNSCSPAHWCREHSHIRAPVHYSPYFMLLDHNISLGWGQLYPGWGQLYPGWDLLAVWQWGPRAPPRLLPALGHCDCVAVTMGDSGATHKIPQELPWKSESHAPAGAGCWHWIPLCHNFPRQMKPRNPNLLLAPPGLFNILPLQTISFFCHSL